MDLSTLLAEFGRQAGLSGLELNEDGVCRLVFDGDLVVDVERSRDGDEVTLVATVGELAPDPGRAILMKLLDANLMGRHTGGAALALDVLGNEVVLCRTVPLDGLTLKSFEQAMKRFVDALEHWTDEIAEDDGEVGEASAAGSAEPGGEDLTFIRL